MLDHEKDDIYFDLYKAAKFTSNELKEFPEFVNLTVEELERLSDLLFDLGIIAQKIMIENND